MNDELKKTPSIEVRDLRRSYVNGKVTAEVLKGLSFDLYPGELTLLMGPSGSGKSTLLSVIGGLLNPDSGSVRVLNTDLWKLSEREIEDFRLRHFGFVFQGFNLFSSLTATDQILILLKYLGLREPEARRIAAASLAEVGLEKVAGSRPIQLSGGEKQRVAIARALAKKPAFLFADEPTSSLDKENGQTVIGLLHQAAHVHGSTIFAVSHDPRLLPHADRLICLEDGMITKDERKDFAHENASR